MTENTHAQIVEQLNTELTVCKIVQVTQLDGSEGWKIQLPEISNTDLEIKQRYRGLAAGHVFNNEYFERMLELARSIEKTWGPIEAQKRAETIARNRELQRKYGKYWTILGD